MDGSSRFYVYGVCHAGVALPEALVGLGDEPVRPLRVGRLAAIVSPTSLTVVRPERRHLSAHQAVLNKIAAVSDLLPMSFGMISDDEQAVQALLSEHESVLLRELTRVTGRVEMTVRLRLQSKDTFSFFVDHYPALRRQRDLCFNGRREPAQTELLDLGRTFEQLLAREREDKTNLAMTALGSVAFELKNVGPSNESVLFDINCLIDREHEPRFDAAIEDLAKRFDENFLLEVHGPWPAYNFVNVSL